MNHNDNVLEDVTPELTFSDQNKIDLKFSISNFVNVFLTLNMPHIDEKDSKPPIFTRKTPKYT